MSSSKSRNSRNVASKICLPQLTHKSQNEFISELKRVHINSKAPLARLPRLLGKEVDLLALYNAVVVRGGFRRVNAKGSWSKVLIAIGLPSSCGNACHALRALYQRYLEPYERMQWSSFGVDDIDTKSISFIGDDSMKSNPDMSRHRNTRGAVSMPERLLPLVYHPELHEIPNYMRETWSLSTRLVDPVEYQGLEKALHSGLPNEIDFSLNALLLMSQSGGVHLNRNPRLLDVLLASVGIFESDDGSFFTVHDDWKRQNGRNFLRYWYEVLEADEGRCLLRPDALDRADLPDPLEPLGVEYDLFNYREDLRYADKEGHRVQLIATVLRNLAMDENNMRILTQSRQAMRFLFLCSYTSQVSLRQLGMEILGLLRYPVVGALVPLCSSLITRCMVGGDRVEWIRGLETIAKLCSADDCDNAVATTTDGLRVGNSIFFSEKLSDACYEAIVSGLMMRDLHMVVLALDAAYGLSSLGEDVCRRMLACRHCLSTLLTLLTLEAQAMGAESLIRVRVMQGPGVSGPPVSQHVPVVQQASPKKRSSASALMPPPMTPRQPRGGPTQTGNTQQIMRQNSVQIRPVSRGNQGKILIAPKPQIAVQTPTEIVPQMVPAKQFLQPNPASTASSPILVPVLQQQVQQHFPVVTMSPKQSFITSKQPLPTSQQPLPTSQQRSHTNQQPVPTSQQPLPTSQQPLSTTQATTVQTPLPQPLVQIAAQKKSRSNVFNPDFEAPKDKKEFIAYWLRKNYCECPQANVSRVQIYAEYQKSHQRQFGDNYFLPSAEFVHYVKDFFAKAELIKVQVPEGNVEIRFNNIKHVDDPIPSVNWPLLTSASQGVMQPSLNIASRLSVPSPGMKHSLTAPTVNDGSTQNVVVDESTTCSRVGSPPIIVNPQLDKVISRKRKSPPPSPLFTSVSVNATFTPAMDGPPIAKKPALPSVAMTSVSSHVTSSTDHPHNGPTPDRRLRVGLTQYNDNGPTGIVHESHQMNGVVKHSSPVTNTDNRLLQNGVSESGAQKPTRTPRGEVTLEKVDAMCQINGVIQPLKQERMNGTSGLECDHTPSTQGVNNRVNGITSDEDSNQKECPNSKTVAISADTKVVEKLQQINCVGANGTSVSTSASVTLTSSSTTSSSATESKPRDALSLLLIDDPATVPPPQNPPSSLPPSTQPCPQTTIIPRKPRPAKPRRSSAASRRSKAANAPSPQIIHKPTLFPTKFQCEWAGCSIGFEVVDKVYSHVYTCHFLPIKSKPYEVCHWAGCDGHVRRAPLSLLSHLHDRHCSPSALQTTLQRRQQAALGNSVSSTAVVVRPHFQQAGQALNTPRSQTSVDNPVPAVSARALVVAPYVTGDGKGTDQPREGPVTKHIRLTAALTLRNLSENSLEARRYLLRHETLLTEIAFSGVESARIMCQCLAMLRGHAHLPTGS